MPPVTYRLQKKNLPAPPAAAPASVEDQQATAQQVDDGRAWSGEPYEGDDAPQGPEGAYSVFSHPGGEVAWLDRAEDGTLTGWVQATDGTLYQYTDADAWAVDVDGAGMAMVEGQGPTGDATEGDEASVEDERADADAVEDLAEGEFEEDGDEGEVDPFAEVEGDPEDGEVDPFAEPEVEEPEDALAEEGAEQDAEQDAELEEFEDDDPTDELEDDEDEDEDDPVSRFKAGSKGKYLMLVTSKG